MRILHVTNAYPCINHDFFGVFIKEQIDSLRLLGIDCEVFFINGKYKGFIEYFKAIKTIKQISSKFDIIHCHHTYSAFLSMFLSGAKVPVLVSFLNAYGNDTERFKPLSQFLRHFVVKRSAGFIVKDDPYIYKRYPDKSWYLPNGVDMDFFKQIPRQDCFLKLGLEPADYVLFISAGGIRRQKRYDIFKKTIDGLRICFPERKIKELVLTEAKRELMPFYYNASRLLLLTSDYEGSPNSVKEALACNIPVVSTKVGDVEWILDGLEGCSTVNKGFSDQLVPCAARAMENERIDGRGQIINKQLDLKSTAFRLIEIYKILLKQF